jgi:hypothetical protein
MVKVLEDWEAADARGGGIIVFDIFRFWSHVGPTEHTHPADRDVFDRLKGAHSFKFDRLPGSFSGPLRTAKVVLLYLSPGWSELDTEEAQTEQFRSYVVRSRCGDMPLRDSGPGIAWLRSRTKCFGLDWSRIRSEMAVLDIGAYHSKSFSDSPLLVALPSSRVSVAWAQDVLFPEAISGKRVVICLRAAPFWGLKVGETYGRSLFAPPTTRGGHMKHGTMRDQIVAAVKCAVEHPG